MSKAQLLEDIFEVSEKDPDGKKFDKGGQRVAGRWQEHLTSTSAAQQHRPRNCSRAASSVLHAGGALMQQTDPVSLTSLAPLGIATPTRQPHHRIVVDAPPLAQPSCPPPPPPLLCCSEPHQGAVGSVRDGPDPGCERGCVPRWGLPSSPSLPVVRRRRRGGGAAAAADDAATRGGLLARSTLPFLRPPPDVPCRSRGGRQAGHLPGQHAQPGWDAVCIHL